MTLLELENYNFKKTTRANADTAYPRPQWQRSHWQSLNGLWKFAFDDEGKCVQPSDLTQWTHLIEVPFAPESTKSGIGNTGFHANCWYEREFETPPGEGRLLLHFGAVDYRTRVWVNDRYIAEHEGGHTPFTLDITHVLNETGTTKVTVWAQDDPHDLAKPRGKQDWRLEPHSIWYPRTTGIWQTVWIERVDTTYIDRIRWTPDFERWEFGCSVVLAGAVPASGIEIKMKLSVGDRVLVNDAYEVFNGEVSRRLALSDPGIDDYRNELLWSPEKPTLIHADVELWYRGELLDKVKTYTAMRTVSIQRDRFMLNGRPYYLRLVLDQGYWPDSLMTAPDDEALRRDVELIKAMGFNGVRKHQKIEDPRFLYWADVLYGPEVKLPDLFDRRRPGGRILTLDNYPHQGQPIMLTEFGGIAYTPIDKPDADKAWGYDRSSNSSELQIKYTSLLETVNKIELFSGFCYTQLTDTFQEANGLLYAERTPKFPIEAIRAATLSGGLCTPTSC